MNSSQNIEEKVDQLLELAARNTKETLIDLASRGIEADGRLGLFLPVESREKELHCIPYNYSVRQAVTYTTMPGEFSALCPFSGLPDYGTLQVDYVPGTRVLELKSLKYYIVSWRNIGATQEEITAVMHEDLTSALEDASDLHISLDYNPRGGIVTKTRT